MKCALLSVKQKLLRIAFGFLSARAENPLREMREYAKSPHPIHLYSMTWISKTQVFKSKITRVFHRFFGKNVFHKR